MAPMKADSRQKSDVEVAVIGHGKVEGPFTEFSDSRWNETELPGAGDGAILQGDQQRRRVGQGRGRHRRSDRQDLRSGGLRRQPGDGRRDRSADEYDGDKIQPPQWWDDFWARHAQQTGFTRQQVVAEMRRTKGDDLPRTEQELAAEAEHYEYPNRAVNSVTSAMSADVADQLAGQPLDGGDARDAAGHRGI